jgi:hypothetical protein
VGIANRSQGSFRAQRLIQVHGAAAGDQKHMLYALFGDEVHYVIGELHGFVYP